jgi:hypothetical protein
MKTFTDFTTTAKSLAKNPLGIIALFIVLIYGFACLVLAVGGSSLQSPAERLPLVWLLTLFPVAVLVTFAWLVAKHHKKLYGPSDFHTDEAFLSTFGPGVEPPEELRNKQVGVAASDSVAESNANGTALSLSSTYRGVVETGYCLLHAAEVLRHRTSTRTGRYRIRAWIEPIEHRSLSDIESVTYRVWDDFDQPVVTTHSERTNFDIWMHVYGEFPILALLKMKDGSTTMLQRYVDIPGRPPD